MTTQNENPYASPASELVTGRDEYGKARVFSFSGRIGRLRYLAYSMGLALVVSIMVPILLGIAAGLSSQDDAELGAFSIIIMVIVYGFMLVGSVVFAVRRLNDFDASGWLALLFLVPIVNFIMSLFLIFKPGTKGDNRYGMQPPANGAGVKVLALALPLVAVLGILAAIAIPQYAEYQQRAASMQTE